MVEFNSLETAGNAGKPDYTQYVEYMESLGVS